MFFRQLFEPVSCTYTYLLADQGEALIIDPVIEKLELYLQLLGEYGVQLVYALDTHTHADHITATGRLQQTTNCDIVMGAHARQELINLRLAENESLKVGKIKLTALYTPGHTDDSYSYVLDDRVFTGDVLLIRATGRTDFQNGDPSASYDSLFNKLLKLPEETLVYPAHDYKGMMVSTIGEEKQFNPRLQVKNQEQYIDIMNNLNLPKPKLIDIAVPANLQCGLNKSQEDLL